MDERRVMKALVERSAVVRITGASADAFVGDPKECGADPNQVHEAVMQLPITHLPIKHDRVRVIAGLVAYAGDGPCPCNIAIAITSEDGAEEVLPLAQGRIVFTTDDVKTLRRAIALGQPGDPVPATRG